MTPPEVQRLWPTLTVIAPLWPWPLTAPHVSENRPITMLVCKDALPAALNLQ